MVQYLDTIPKHYEQHFSHIPIFEVLLEPPKGKNETNDFRNGHFVNISQQQMFIK